MKCKELPIRTITSITFPLLKEKPFSFDSTRYGRHVDFESSCHQSSLL